MRRLWLIFAQATTVAVAVLFVLATLKPEWLNTAPRSVGPVQLVGPFASAASRPAPAHPGLAQAARRAAPAVVSITASKPPPRVNPRDPWSRFFGGSSPDMPQQGLGSGVIVSADGYLLTNSHVVVGASDIEVQLADGRQARARLVGADPETDVALLKIEMDTLPVIAFGDAQDLQVGDTVLAIGNPFNVGQTVTSGIVSALGRSRLGINTFENFIQTDAAINPGNSGGALVDAEGNLVGINTAIFSRSGGSLGIGFAIPASTAREVMTALLEHGRVERGWIGVQTRELTPELAQALKLDAEEGVVVSRVVRKAPAEGAGIQAGDLLQEINGRAVRNPPELLAAVSALKPGASVAVKLLRGKRAMELRLKVGQRPPPPKPDLDQDQDPD
ncbi:S1C family serine protease [Burkholderiaceae bacterium UC74_6]